MWFVRCLLWATPLAVLCYAIAGPYQRLLIGTALTVLGLPSRPDAMRNVDLSAANVLGMYSAMCLASLRAPRRRRIVALLAGLAALVALEWVTGVTMLRMAMTEAAHGSLPPAAAEARDQALDLIRWISVPVLWMALLGRWELRGILPSHAAGHVPQQGGAPRRRTTRIKADR
jgi:hypothetical protein